MSRKNVITPFKVLDAVDMSEDQTSEKITDIQYQDNVGFQVSWSGATGTGEVFVEVSNDKEDEPSNWTALDFGSQITISGASGSHIININQCPYAKMRVRYEENTATGSLTVTLVSKAV
ncbi:MAG: hypothetical protein ACAH17_01045 [Candidatus Paceibacterota bacterium]